MIKLMTHIVAGYPDVSTSRMVAETILESNVDILEVQFPFSDPIADGPVIAEANDVALKNGVKLADGFELVGHLTNKYDKPVYIMTYYNIVFHFGVEAFCKKAKEIGSAGLIIPDYPFDEDRQDGLITACNKNDLNFTEVVAPTTRLERLKQIVAKGSGFIYAMARTGITGNKTEIGADTIEYLKSIKAETDLPLAVGFGLSEKSQIEALEPYTDIAVVGTALIKAYRGKSGEEVKNAVTDFLTSLR